MVGGAASLMAIFYALHDAGSCTATRGENVLDSGAFFYDVYECADGKYVSVAPIEDKFLEEFLHRMEIDPAEMPPKMDRRRWPEAKAKVAALFKRTTRDEWCRLLQGSDACFPPVLSLAAAPNHPPTLPPPTSTPLTRTPHPAPPPPP